MPNRIIREGIITSDRVNSLDFGAEVFYRRLLSKVDDYGLFDARPSVLLASLYPLQLSKVRETNIVRWLADVEKANLVRLYAVDSKNYLQVLDTKWPARSEPKYPIPPENNCAQHENNCAQLTPYSKSLNVVEDVTPKPPKGDLPESRFDEFWEAYPKLRRDGREKCRKVWKSKRLDAIAEEVIAGLNRWKASEDWAKEGGKFVKGTIAWLNAGKWEAHPTPAAPPADELGVIYSDPAEVIRKIREAS